ncbi:MULTISPECIES: hypothetical protein [unclassified Halomonas]|uniref:hypothetical protein n=1 Tax=unclassified Halomonas TaxID=2609666 RepID=UPI0028876684|nr:MULTISPECIES: hypothetical protein [unclassified Halomonas]MDT0501870.1 hypothetical protein [Halomonas sp. PAR7]MDT0513541.1 hypothetical protein [Halomonas sp. LES1]MDT0592537.1 hypothetical protein [Halomonas sp. PAR8]
MNPTLWKSTLLATLLALGLAGCGDGNEQAPDVDASRPAQDVESETAPAVDEPAGMEVRGETEETPGADRETEEGAAVEEPGEESAAPGEAGTAEVAPDEAAVSADAETLAESPATPLEDDAALPGEATREDVDAIIEENERRFEEAQRRIDEQFQQAEQERVAPEPMADGDIESGIDIDSSLGEDPLTGEEAARSDIDAIIEEQERRFEEAQRELEQQFEEIEREVPELEGFDGEPEGSEVSAPAEEAREE